MREGQLLSVLQRTSTLYANVTEVTRERHRVNQPSLRRVHREVKRLFHLLKAEHAEESVAFLHALRRFSFLSAATPLPFNHPEVWPKQSAEMLRHAEVFYPVLYPGVQETLAVLLASMADLQSNPSNPIGEWLLSTVPRRTLGLQGYVSESHRYLVLADSRTIAPVQAWVDSNHLDLRVGKAGDFTDGWSVDEQIFLGSSAWFPAWAFVAPRTQSLHLVQNEWLWDEATFAAHFVYNQRHFAPVAFNEVAAVGATESTAKAEALDRIKMDVPHIDWQRIIGREQVYALQEGEETVRAKLHVLSGNAGVWLRVGEDETILGIELDREAGHRVQRFDIEELQPGDHVLLRTQGAGDFLKELAETILGAEGAQAHKLHREWKQAVRKQIELHVFPHRSLRALRNAGATRVSEHNLRFWSSDQNLRPGQEGNFRALVEFAGMADRFEDIELAVRKLKHARLSAGQRIGHLIRDAVADADVEELRRDGRQDFGLPGGQLGGTLTAYTLIAIGEDTAMIGPSRIGRVFALQGEDYA